MNDTENTNEESDVWDSPAFWQRIYKVNYVQAARIVVRMKRLVSQAHNAGYEDALEKMWAGLPKDNTNESNEAAWYNTCLHQVRALIASLSEQTK